VNPSALTSLIAVRELKAKPGSTIIYNLISSQAVPEIVSESGGKSVRSRVGHSYIKKLMAETGAIFGGEHSGHFYFADFWKADSGMLAALYALTELSGSDKKLSELLHPFNRYFSSGEINTKVADTQAALARISAAYASTHTIDDLDGLTVQGQGYWFNVRPSNTEPLLRLNVEAHSAELLATKTIEVQGVISAP
jgi:phosphomannomutase